MTTFPSVSFSHHDGVYIDKNSKMNCDVDVLLPIDYVLGDGDVLCGRSKKCFAHPGSTNLRRLVQDRLEAYIDAPKKTEKSIIIRDVVNKIREDSSNSGFVKYDPLTGRYYDVGETMAREKTSQAFRDALYGYYKRSSLSKTARRQHRTRNGTLDDVSISVSSKSSSSSNATRFSEIESQVQTLQSCTLPVGVQMTIQNQHEPYHHQKQLLYQNQNHCNESNASCPLNMLVHAATDDHLTYFFPETTSANAMLSPISVTGSTSTILETTNSLFVSTGAVPSAPPTSPYRRRSLDWDLLCFHFPEESCTLSDDPFEPIPIGGIDDNYDFNMLL